MTTVREARTSTNAGALHTLRCAETVLSPVTAFDALGKAAVVEAREIDARVFKI